MEIRKAILNDCKELSYLKRQIWEETYRGIYPDRKLDHYNYENNENKFKGIVNNPDIDFYVAIDQEKIIAYMSTGIPFRPYLDYKQEIGMLYILKSYQGQGIGKKLFHLALEIIKEKGYDNFFISCNRYNLNAQQFYKRMGGVLVHVEEENDLDKSKIQVKFHYDIH